MTLVRRHLVGALVVVLALAAGIALGGGPLQGDAVVRAASAPTADSEVDPGPTRDDLAAAAAPTLYGSRLAGRTVAVLATPGVTAETLDALVAGIESADGSVSGRWRLTEALTDPAEKTLVETLGDQLTEQLQGAAAEPDAPGYERLGQLIGSSLATRRADASTASQDALTIRQSLAAAGLVRVDDREARQAPLVLLALGGDLDDYVIGGIVDGLAARSAGTVVAAPVRDGDLTVVEGLAAVTTVDGIDGEAGRLAAVLALTRVEQAAVGSYGMSGADGLLPLG